MSDDKTEEPTDKKLEDARDKGQVTKSEDLTAAASLLVMTVCLTAASSLAGDHVLKAFAGAIDRGVQVRDVPEMQAVALDLVLQGCLASLPFVAASMAVGVLATMAQVGVLISFEPLQPDFEKVNPASGIKKIFSMKPLIELAKTVLKALLLGSTVFVIGKGLLPLLMGASQQTPAGVVALGWAALIKLFTAATVIMVVIGPADFGLQRWMFMRDQRMSKDEVKREYKDAEGDPQLKGERKALAREMATSAPPKSRVPGASVVVTNPTHYAVALRYQPGETPLPVIVAKGADAVALEIRAIAEQHGVPIVGDPPLARALFKVSVDDTVPEALFEAVAAVLRWVATLERLDIGGGRARS